MSLPKKTFARKIINRYGYDHQQMVNEVAAIDNCSQPEAERRITEAKEQAKNRAAGQFRRRIKREYGIK